MIFFFFALWSGADELFVCVRAREMRRKEIRNGEGGSAVVRRSVVPRRRQWRYRRSRVLLPIFIVCMLSLSLSLSSPSFFCFDVLLF